MAKSRQLGIRQRMNQPHTVQSISSDAEVFYDALLWVRNGYGKGMWVRLVCLCALLVALYAIIDTLQIKSKPS
jgi:hypothetical protein